MSVRNEGRYSWLLTVYLTSFKMFSKKLRSKGVLTEDDVKEAMKEVKRALLEADVNFKVVKSFIKAVSDRAVGEEVLKGLNPGHMVIKIVKEEMDKLMGSDVTELKLLPSNEITVIMMCGLQGAGKTTTAAKLAYQFKNKGKKPLLVACDVYRPAAINSCRSMVKRLVCLSLRWEIIISRLILPRLRSCMQKRII